MGKTTKKKSKQREGFYFYKKFATNLRNKTISTEIMNCAWLKLSPNLQKGIDIVNRLENTKFEQFLQRIVTKLKLQDTEIFTGEEIQKLEKIFKVEEDHLALAIKTVLYLFKRMLKFIFMPSDLKNDLYKIGLSNDRADFFVKVWSAETQATLTDLSSENAIKQGESLNFSWKVNAELSSEYRKKCKIAKAYFSIDGHNEETEIEMTHAELYSMFLQFEAIQTELDNLYNFAQV